MRLVTPLLAAALTAVTPLLASSTIEVSRTPPPLYADHLAPLLTSREEVMEGRTAFPDEDGGGIVLLYEKILYQGDDGLVYRALHMVQYAVDQSGVERMGSDIYTFDREREDIFLIDAATIRPDGERLPVDGKGAFIQTPQHEAENSLYTSQAELNLIFPHVAPGCITEATVLIRENQPVIPGEFALSQTFSRGWPAHRQRLVLDLPDAALARIRSVTTGSGVPEPVSERYADGRERRTWTRTGAPYVRWEENGPQYEYRGPTLWLTTLTSWDAVAAWFHRLVADRSELGAELQAEVDRWTENVTDRSELLALLTEKVANDVRYVGLEFGLAGYQPHPCAQVWSARYGDCKDKANLLRAMLEHKGIPAHVVLLQTSGLGRVQGDSPSWHQFNHAILAAEDGKGGFIFCDPTVKFLPAGTIGFSDIARDVLVVLPDKAVWARTPDTLASAIRLQGDLVLAPDGALSGWFGLTGEGVDAAGYAEHLNGQDRDARLRWMQRLTEGFFPGAEVMDVEYTPVTNSVRATTIRGYFTRGPRASGDQALVFPYPKHWLPSVDTAGERLFPYVAQRREESVAVAISVPEGWGAQTVPAPFSAPSAIAEFQASWSAEPGRIQATLAWHPKQHALAAAEYPVLQRSVRALTAWLEQPVVLAHAGNGTLARTEPASADLKDFPILPTGKGQLRLANERYPEDSRPVQRRAALEKILQWFPNDTETIFEAKVWLASIDWNEKTNRDFADATAALLERHGQQVSPSLRAWAGYLEAKARWAADKAPEAIEHLRQIAEDASLTPFRRGWAAYFAGRYMRETDARQARDFLLRHDDYECEARDSIVRLLASLQAEVAEPTEIAAWAGDFATGAGESADALLAAGLQAVIEGDDRVPEARRAAAIAAVLGAVPSDDVHPKIAAERARWEQMSSRDAAVRAYREAVESWLRDNRPEWWTAQKDSRFADADAVIKQIQARNDASDGPGTLDATMQLVLHHRAEIDDLAKYSRWSLWWLRRKELSPPLVDVIGHGLLLLPAEAGTEVIQAWHEYAVFLREKGRLDEARAIYDRVLDLPAAKDYQRVDAGGELGLLELKAGNIDAALAAFHRIVPIHTTHKWSIDYLYPAVLLHLGRGEDDEALALIEAMRAQETEYIQGSDQKVAVENLLRAAQQPQALRAYWNRMREWTKAWDALLELNGIERPAPHEVPLEHDFEALNSRIEKAVTSKNIGAYLRELDTYARMAAVIPICGGDFSEQADKAGRIAPALAQRVCGVGLALFDGASPVDPEFDNSVDIWKSIMLADVGRTEEAAACGRALFERLGAQDRQGLGGLRLWILYTRGTAGEAEAVARMEEILAGEAEIPDRLKCARILSDTYWQSKNTSAQRALVEREMARSGFDATTAEGKVMTARLEELNTAARSGGELTRAIDAWLARWDVAWLDHVPPRSLDEPRFSAMKPPLYSEQEGCSSSERIKFNLLAAREEALPSDTRVGAFCAAVFSLAYHSNNIAQYVDMCLSAAELELLPLERRARFVYTAASMAAAHGDSDLLARVHASASLKLLAEERRQSVDAAHKALTLVDGQAEGWAQQAHAALTDAPADDLRLSGLEYLIGRLAYTGDYNRANELVALAKDLKLDAGSADKTAAGLRLAWSRTIRRAQDVAEFARALRGEVGALPGAKADVPDRVRLAFSFGSSRSLTEDEHLAEAAWVLDHGHLVGERYPLVALWALQQARSLRRRDPLLFPRLLELALSANGADADREAWTAATALGSDVDQPKVRARVEAALERFQKSPAAASHPQTAKTAASVRAFIALRTSAEANPPQIFRDLDRNGVPEADRHAAELQFLLSRGRIEEALRRVDLLSPDALRQPRVFRFARAGLIGAGRRDEAELLDQAMREQLERSIGDIWMDADKDYHRSWVDLARVIDAADLFPPAWFERAVGLCATEVDRGMLRIQQAQLQKDWVAVRSACDLVLREIPDMYDVFYDRAVARHHLGDKAGAAEDLRVMLTHSLDHEEYQEAVRLYREITHKAPPRPRR